MCRCYINVLVLCLLKVWGYLDMWGELASCERHLNTLSQFSRLSILVSSSANFLCICSSVHDMYVLKAFCLLLVWVAFLLLGKLLCYACISKYSSRYYSNGWIEGREHTCGRVQKESMEVVITVLNEGDWRHILYVWELWWDFTMELSLQRQVIHSLGSLWGGDGQWVERRKEGYSEWVDSFSQSSHCKAPHSD